MKRIWLTLIGVLGVGCSDLAPEPYPPLKTLEVSPDNELILTGDTLILVPTVYDATGAQADIPSWAPLHWSSDDPSIEITRDGRLVGREGSNARVTAFVAGLTDGVHVRINPRELDVEVTVVLSQATQDLAGRTPMIAGRDLVFRAYVTSPLTNYYESVDLRATFNLRGRELQTPILTTENDSIGAEIIDELRYSYFHHVTIPGSIVQQGLTLTVELDPSAELPSELSLNPMRVTLELPVVSVPVHRTVIVPTLATGGASDEILEWVSDLTNTSHHLAALRTMLPITEIEAEVHEPFHLNADLATGYDGWTEWVESIEALRVMEGRKGWYYYGIIQPTYTRGIGGIAYRDGFTAAGMTIPALMAHEVGHNFSLGHSPCGNAPDADPDFPYANGVIGQWGVDLYNLTVHHPGFSFDMMGYCLRFGPQWVSDYHYNKAFNFRNRMAGVTASSDEGSGPMTLIWGRINDDGIALNPAFRVSTTPELPSGSGDYTLVIIGPDDEMRYQSRFTPKAVRDTDRPEQHFHYAIPYSGEISRIVVIGPEGRDEIGRGTEPPIAILRDRASGQVTAIYRDWTGLPSQLAPGAEATTRIIIGDGVPR